MNILWIGSLLILYGLLALFSVSIHESFTLTLGRGDPSNYFYFIRQLRNIAVGLFVAFFVYKISLWRIRSWRYWILVWVILLTLLLFTPLGIELNGARLWLKVPLLWTLQPGEFFKLWFVLLISDRLVRKKDVLQSFWWFISFCIVAWMCFALFFLLRDNGTALILGLTSLIMYWYLWGKKRFVLMMIWGGVLLGVVVVMSFGYVRERFSAFLDPNADSDGRNATYQVKNALTSVGAWWFWGKWYGKWLQKFWYIPEAQSDYIFAAFSEEVGFIWNITLIILYLYLFYFIMIRIRGIRDDYLRWVGIGIVSLIALQTFVNMGVNINIMPSTGLTLPFISFWGTAIMVNMIELVLVHKILVEGKEMKKLY